MKKRRGGPPARLRAAPHVSPLIFPPHRARRRQLGSRQHSPCPIWAPMTPFAGRGRAGRPIARRPRPAIGSPPRVPRPARFRDSGRSAAVLILSADGWQNTASWPTSISFQATWRPRGPGTAAGMVSTSVGLSTFDRLCQGPPRRAAVATVSRNSPSSFWAAAR